MTGYGKTTCEAGEKLITVEIKSLNSKQLDIFLRLPALYRDREMDMRNEISNRLKRGKIEINVSVERKEGKATSQLNTEMIRAYYQKIRTVADELGLPTSEPTLQAILRMPDVFSSDKEMADEAEVASILQTLTEAITEVEGYRNKEGEAMSHDIKQRINWIERYLKQIDPFEKERMQIIRARLDSLLLEGISKESIDQNRFEQEMIFYLEKLDISEEKTRLLHHLGYFTDVMAENDQVGRKLGFVAQEIGREINTIGSKANHSGIQKLVVLMKDELEKVKEQLMNVL
jgi:uncharacterized protein (TIGR00255 family)